MSSRAAKRHTGGPPELGYRLFMAVEIPATAVESLVSWQRRYLAAGRALRMTPAGQLHITLVFLGQMGEKQKGLAAAQLDAVEKRSAFKVEATRLVGLPKGRHPRVIAAGLDEPQGRLEELHDQLASALVAKRLYKKEKRPFFPHVTIARVRGRPRLDLAEIKPEPVQFTAVRVTLYNSILKQKGALHEPLKSIQLT